MNFFVQLAFSLFLILRSSPQKYKYPLQKELELPGVEESGFGKTKKCTRLNRNFQRVNVGGGVLGGRALSWGRYRYLLALHIMP